MTARRVNGVLHGSRCACLVCDPGDTKLKAARARARGERRAAAALPPPTPGAPVRPPRRPLPPPSWETKRMRDLLRDGHAIAEAIEQIEKERRP